MMTQGPAHRLLLVEDNPGDALLVSEALAEFDNRSLSLEPVGSLKQALEALGARSFDGIILDLTLPDSRGVDTLARVAEATDAVPIVVLTGLDGGGGLRDKAEELGAFELVCKNEMAQLLPRSVYWSLRHKRAEARHLEFVRLVSAIPDAVVVTDRAGVVHFVNDAAFELFGNRGDGFLGQPIGFSVKVGTVSEIEIRRGNESRACEMRVVACEWNGMPAALALIRDMTEQKRLSGQLQHAQKMEAIGMMAGGIAHDFNNLLLVMLVHAELLRDDCDPADERLAGVFEIIHSIERAQALTRQLLAFSRKQPTATKVVNLGDRVEQEGPSGRETILIVEDDQAVMRATAATLRKGGYTVLTASNGDEARRLVQPKADGIDLVLSDVVMPQLSGPEFAEYLASIRPDIPLIFMTGYSEYPVSTESGDNRIVNHRAIMKPFRPRDLLSIVREVLDARARAAA